jgi:DNA-binding NtrC family response regulator/tetratricopeptide (TPR) repeat protein
VELVADRFAITSAGASIDLATGRPVVLKIDVGGGPMEQQWWSSRCEMLNKIHHPRIARLVDFGALGESQRFEAWDCTERRHRDVEDAAETIHRSVQFLRSCGVQNGAVSAPDVYESDGQLVLLPPAAIGAGEETAHGIADNPLDNCGIHLIDRHAEVVIDHLFASFTGSLPHFLTIWGPPGSGRSTSIVRAARVARINGFVPIDVRLLNRVDLDLLKRRQLCLIEDNSDVDRGSGALKSVFASPRPHVVLQSGIEESGAFQSVELERITREALAAAVRPQRVSATLREQIVRVAAAAQGSPARFAALLWHSRMYRSARSDRARRRDLSRVAEQASTYGARSAAVVERPQHDLRSWPAPAELIEIRRKSDAAVELLKKGRYAPAVRQLRQAIGGMSRRGDWAYVNDAVIALASALLARGDPRGALNAIQEAHPHLERISNLASLVDATVISGHASIDLARLDDAESVLGTAAAVARRLGDPSRIALASLALARCLFWKGRYTDAASMIAALAVSDEAAPSLGVRVKMATSRTSVGLGDLTRAMTLAREAIEGAARLADDSLRARALAAAAFVRLAVGDADGLDRDVRACLAAARAAHDPMVSVRARLLLAESDRRRGRAASATSYLGRIRRIGLPPIVQARVDLVQALMDPAGTGSEIAMRHSNRCGLAALSLYADSSGVQRSRTSIDSTEALVAILDLCQTADDEDRVLSELCGRLRRHLHAAAVAVWVREGASLGCVAHDGARIDPEIAERAISGDLAAAPHRLHERVEAAVPIRYAGAVIGAIVARWPVGTPYDLSRAVSLLTMASAAAAPVVSAAIGRRSPAAAPALATLVGVTAIMSELRDAVERAAKAPFSVLVEGESGSGKELVAKAIHRLSEARDRAFCTLNCAALPDDLVEAELFGHARGAFTGAVNERAGVFEEAHGGTLFLDEVGELAPRAQAKLLRVIQEGELRRIGENLPRRVDVRIVSATNRDLRSEATAGRFRIDLLYRLDVIRLRVPPLRERPEDVALLTERFWRQSTERIGSHAVLSNATIAALARYDWPGNVRELQNVLAALAVRTPRRGVVTPAALPPQFANGRPPDVCRLDVARRTFEERFVRAALVRTGGHRGRAAAELGITRQGLTKLLTRLRIEQTV